MAFKKRFFHALLILAVISATISPACAFISGQNATWVEICSGISSKLVKTDEKRETAPDVTSDSCSFCFHNAHMSSLETDRQELIASKPQSFYNDFINEIALIRAVKTTQSRAPPAFPSL